MDVFEAVRTVLAVRRYRDKSVPENVIRRIVEAGRLSASAGNQQPWHFIVIDERATIERVGEIMTTGHYARGASHVIAVMIVKDKRIAISDGSRAIQNMILTAWSEGVGSNWIGFGHMPAIEELLGVPETHQALAVLALGEIASRERFGTPFA